MTAYEMRISDWSSDVCSSDLLRQRLLRSAIAIVALFFICYYFAPHLYDFLVQPLADVLETQGGNRRMIYTALPEAKIGRASWRERVCQYVYLSGVAGSLYNNYHITDTYLNTNTQ